MKVEGITFRSEVNSITTRFVKRVFGMNLDAAASNSTFNHELAHAFGLIDRYRDAPNNGYSVPDPGYRGNLMGDMSPQLNHEQIGIILENTSMGWKPSLRAAEKK
ncbi:MAG: hypothetical protein IPP82_09375 [Xanthomonadales bacterium]|nr:hypothetical protein [Xanthomonadales bacterium]